MAGTEKSAATPNDPLTREEYRAMWGVVIGVTFTGLPSNVQDVMDQLLDNAHENCAKRHLHEPWAQQQGTITLVNGTTSYAFPANFKRLMSITEAPTSGTTRPATTTRLDFKNARDGADWDLTQTTPRWFFEYMDESEPPVQYWRRYPTPAAGGTATILYRPFFAPLAASGGGSDRFTWLNADYVEEIRDDFLSNYYKIVDHNPAKAALFKQSQQIATAENEDASSYSTEDPIQQGLDPAFRRQMG